MSPASPHSSRPPASAASAARATGARPTTTVASRAAAGWLAQQFTDHYVYPGGTYFDGGSTADSVFALAAAKAGKTKIDAAMRYFARHVENTVGHRQNRQARTL